MAPTVLLVPGACTESSCFDRLIHHLEKAGLETVAVSHPSANPITTDEHSAESAALNITENYLAPLLRDGKDVLVYAVSSGGTWFGHKGPSFVKSEREARGEKGGIVGIVYMSSVLPPAGVTQLAHIGGKLPDGMNHDEEKNVLYFDQIIPLLFNDADPAEQNELAQTCLPHSWECFVTPVLPPLWADVALYGRRIWLKAMLDALIQPEAADVFMELSGVDWEVVERDIGHCGFIACPDVVADIIVDSVKRFGE